MMRSTACGSGVAFAGALVFAVAFGGAAHAGAGPQQLDRARSDAVQIVLDRLLGPGAAITTVTDQPTAGPAATDRGQFGSAHAIAVERSTRRADTGSESVLVQQDVVHRTMTITATGRTVLREDVAVVLDRSRLGTTRPSQLKDVISAAASADHRRGDCVSIVVVRRFAAPAGPRVAQPHPPTGPLPAAGMLIAVLAVVLVSVLVRRRRSISS